MRSSRWQAQGNVYLVAEEPLTAELVREQRRRRRRHPRGARPRRRLASDRDLEPRRLARGDVGQRHADRGALARRADRGDRRSRSGSASASVAAHARRRRLVEQELGPVVVGEPEEVDGIRFTPVDVGNPHAVVDGDPGRARPDRPAARDAPALSRTARTSRSRGALDARDDRGARLGAGRGRDRAPRGRARSRSSPRSAAAGRRCAFPAVTSTCGSRARAPGSPARRSARQRARLYREGDVPPRSLPGGRVRPCSCAGTGRGRAAHDLQGADGRLLARAAAIVGRCHAGSRRRELKQLERVKAFKAFAAGREPSGALKLIAADPAAAGKAYMDVGVERVGAGLVAEVAAATRSEISTTLAGKAKVDVDDPCTWPPGRPTCSTSRRRLPRSRTRPTSTWSSATRSSTCSSTSPRRRTGRTTRSIFARSAATFAFAARARPEPGRARRRPGRERATSSRRTRSATASSARRRSTSAPAPIRARRSHGPPAGLATRTRRTRPRRLERGRDLRPRRREGGARRGDGGRDAHARRSAVTTTANGVTTTYKTIAARTIRSCRPAPSSCKLEIHVASRQEARDADGIAIYQVKGNTLSGVYTFVAKGTTFADAETRRLPRGRARAPATSASAATPRPRRSRSRSRSRAAVASSPNGAAPG